MMKTTLPDLTGLRALHLEDEVLIGLDGEMILRQLGFQDVALVQDLDSAFAHLEHNIVDFALLDINLGDGRTSLPFATALSVKGVPFAFASGYNKREHTALDFNVPFIAKPFDDATIAAAVAKSLAPGPDMPRAAAGA